MVIASEMRDCQSDILVPGDYNLPVQLAAVGLRGIDNEDVVIENYGVHGVTPNPQAVGCVGIRAPLLWGCDYAFDWRLMKDRHIVAFFSTRGRDKLQQRYGNQLGLFQFLATGSRVHNLKIA